MGCGASTEAPLKPDPATASAAPPVEQRDSAVDAAVAAALAATAEPGAEPEEKAAATPAPAPPSAPPPSPAPAPPPAAAEPEQDVDEVLNEALRTGSSEGLEWDLKTGSFAQRVSAEEAEAQAAAAEAKAAAAVAAAGISDAAASLLTYSDEWYRCSRLIAGVKDVMLSRTMPEDRTALDPAVAAGFRKEFEAVKHARFEVANRASFWKSLLDGFMERADGTSRLLSRDSFGQLMEMLFTGRSALDLVSEGSVDEFFAAADSDGDGHVSFPELVAVLEIECHRSLELTDWIDAQARVG